MSQDISNEKKENRPSFIKIGIITIAVLLIASIVRQKMISNENKQWRSVSQVSFSISDERSLVKVVGLPAKFYLEFLNEAEGYKLVSDSPSKHEPIQCNVDIEASGYMGVANTRISCSSPSRPGEAKTKSVLNASGNYVEGVIEAIKQLQEDTFTSSIHFNVSRRG